MAAVIKRDVIIAGAGPAGAVCAAYLARAGIDVLLLDKELFPRDKVCGDIVRESVVRHIEQLEAVAALDEMSSCIRRLNLISPSGNEAVIPYECYTMPRARLDQLLVDVAVSWGAEFRQGCRVENVIRDGGKVCGVLVREKGQLRELKSRIVIAADGAASAISGMINETDEISEGVWMGQRAYFKGVKIDKGLSKEQYDAGGIFCFDDKKGPAYFWVVPVGADGVKRGICSVGMIIRGGDDLSDADIASRLTAWLDCNDKIKVCMGEAEQISPWSFGRLPDMNQGKEPVGNGCIFIGDAAAQTIPLYGDGIGAAADSAKAAADAVEDAFRNDDFSEERIRSRFNVAMTALRRSDTEEYENRAKLDRLLIESMVDPHVMDMVIARI